MGAPPPYVRCSISGRLGRPASGLGADCIVYLMGNHIITERMVHHDPRAMLYAPLRTVIWENAGGDAWFSVDQPSTQFASLGIPAITGVGLELDRKLANLLEVLNVEVPRVLTQARAHSL